MNIFVLAYDPFIAAKQMCDKHVVKMIVETAQMLSTAHRVLDGVPLNSTSASGRKYKKYIMPDAQWDNILCKAVMPNHPCTAWCLETQENYKWLCRHGMQLLHEYTARYGKVHKMEPLYWDYLIHPPKMFKHRKNHILTEFPQAMPPQYKDPDPVVAYRQYYINEKSRFAKWKLGNVPDWYTEGLNAKQIPTRNEQPTETV
jgi:hypothetical protein